MRTDNRYRNWIIGFIVLVSHTTHLTSVFAQRKIEKEKNEIMSEGLALYTIILANWTSSDIYYENEFNTSNVNGYLSYKDKDTVKTIFWREIDTASAEYKAKTFKAVQDSSVISAKQSQQVSDLRIITKTFHYPRMIITKKNCKIVDDEREPTEYEKMLMDFRKMTYDAINKDTAFFKEYKGTSLKAVPVDFGKQVKVYIYSASASDDFVPLGGDYLLIYGKKEKDIIEKHQLHDGIIMISTRYKGKSSDASKSTYHNHKGDSPDLITQTDIATLLLYKKMVTWDEHRVISEKYTCIFTLIDRKLQVIPTEEYQRLNKTKNKIDKEAEDSNFH